MKLNWLILGFFCLGIGLSACKKEDKYENPFDDPSLQPPDTTDSLGNIEPGSFAYLHYKIFKPTCANSGCHDGTFEPNFTTIESSYNTLVYHPIIKNDPNGTYTYRVLPGNPNASVLMNRLTTDIDGISGIMPLSIDQDSDWLDKKDEYIENIRTWIQEGAKDMFGNPANAGNKVPQFAGVVAFANGGGNPLPRNSDDISIPLGVNSVDLWFSFTDDSTASSALTYNKIKFSESVYDNDTDPEYDLLVASPITEEGYFSQSVQYTHKITFDPSVYPADKLIFFRVYVKDPQHDVTEIPQDGSLSHIISYFSFIRE